MISNAKALDRLLDNIAAGPNGCHIWTKALHPSGYGAMGVKMDGKWRNIGTHRAAYELLIGPIPAGLFVDHTCHNLDVTCLGGASCLHRRCVNPLHLEAVTNAENSRRSRHTIVGRNCRVTHCSQGHAFDEANTYRPARGGRICKRCRADRMIAAQSLARQLQRETAAPCGHVSRVGNVCDRPLGHDGKHHCQFPGGEPR